MRIAVMEQNATDRMQTVAMVRDTCCHLQHAKDIQITEYSDYYRFTCAFKETDFDLLVIAIDGIRDFEAAWKIRDMDRNIPIVIIAGDEEYASASWRINVTDYLVKPLEPDGLRHSLERVLVKRKQSKLSENAVYSEGGIKNG